MRKAFYLPIITSIAACGGDSTGPGPGGPGGDVVVSTEISDATTWSPSASDCDVQVTTVVKVSAALTIQPGTKICFQANAGLLVGATGSLNAVGTADKHIVFTGTSQTKGFWKGLAFLSLNNDNKLIYADVEYAGSPEPFCCGFFTSYEDAKASVVVGDYATAAQVTIQHSSFASSANYGLFAFEGSKIPEFSANHFADNDKAPVSVFFTTAGALDSATQYSGGSSPNQVQYARVLSGDALDMTTTLAKLDVPWGMGLGVANSVFTVRAPLTVVAGAQLAFEANSGILVDSAGQLTASGTPTEHVTFTGRSQTPGFWKGLAFLSVGNALTNTDVSYGGNADPFCCGFWEPSVGNPAAVANLVVGDYATSAGLALTDVTSTQSGGRGVDVLGGSVTQSGTCDLLTGNAASNYGL